MSHKAPQSFSQFFSELFDGILPSFKPACPHEEYRETLACDGVCVKCGENLGWVREIDNTKHRRLGYDAQVEQLMREGKA
jgi:hypothetical protein